MPPNSFKEEKMFNYCNYIVYNLRTYVRYINTVTELNNLSDEDLEILGLTRGEIPIAAYKTYLEHK